MPTTRRDFLRTSTLAAAATLLPRPAMSAASHPLRILILGGTSFIGPHQVRYAMDRGHEITLFNRGRTNTHLFPELEKLVGDRNGDLESLKGHKWDVVIDNSASNPDWVRLSAEALRDSVDCYIYVSSRSAYAHFRQIPMNIGAPAHSFESTGIDPSTPPRELPYGLRKSLCEQEAQKVFGDRALVFRPGLIIGPGDNTDRFSYWPIRIHRGGEVLAPGDGTDPVQIIDVRDLTEWMVRLAENGTTGTFNGVGPATPRPMTELLYGIRAATTAETTFTWVDTDFLLEQGVRPYSHMPVWMPARGDNEGFARFDLTPEVESGLTFRPLADTARDTLEFHFSRTPERQAELRAGISPEREREVLAAWHAR
ncbi:MAG: NAD-dependent epimerase/dehydratase family protein [Rhodothermales bacterium]|nr:NAD-dependent epimerase/dehydratase family protein [Rhodothermales bacterium]MBO6781455.1 NAD-dependent epimerase/dehydratase family protein [Rhodothermales bacterium]